MAKEEVPKGQLPTIILSTLFDCDKYGYEIIELIKQKTNDNIVIKQPSLYSSLKRMEDQGLISSYWRDSDIGGRRHYYSITDYGKKYAEKWQVDWNSLSSKNNTNTVLQQTNILDNLATNNSSVNKATEDTEKSQKQSNNNSFVQFDLFTSQNIIAEPSDELFNSIKMLREEANSRGTEKNSIISDLREVANKNNETINVSKNDSAVVDDIHKSFMELKKNQKSFVQSIKDNDISPFEFSDTNQEQNSPSPTPEVLQQQVETDKKELISQDTTEESEKDNLKLDKEYFDDISTDDYSTSSEFVDLDNINDYDDIPNVKNEDIQMDFDKEKDVDVYEKESIQSTTEQFSADNQENINESDTKIEQPAVDDNYKVDIKTTHDDAVYITERLNYETLPKVKKIEPNRFEKYATYDSEFDKKITKIYNDQQQSSYNDSYADVKDELKNDNLSYSNDTQKEEKIDNIQKTSNAFESDITYTNLNELKNHFAKEHIKFGIHQKQDKLAEQHIFVKINKLNVYSFGIVSIIAVLESLIMFLCLKNAQPMWNWLYIVLPLIVLTIECTFFVKYLQNKNKLCTKASMLGFSWLYNVALFFIISLVLFSLNLLCGMSFDNIFGNLTTLLYPIIVVLNYPLLALVNFIFIKYSIIK